MTRMKSFHKRSLENAGIYEVLSEFRKINILLPLLIKPDQ